MIIRQQLLAGLLAVLLCLPLASCGMTGSEDNPNQSAENPSPADVVSEETEENAEEAPVDMPDEKETANDAPLFSTSLRMTSAGDFSCGRAFVRYEEASQNPLAENSGSSTLACIDTSGTVLFTLPDDVNENDIVNYQNGYASFQSDEHGLCIIDLEGNVIFDESAVRAGTEFDDIVTYGDQYVLCHKIVSSFDANEHQYSIYDGLKQDWCFAFQEMSFLPEDYYPAAYFGDGVFMHKATTDYFHIITPNYQDMLLIHLSDLNRINRLENIYANASSLDYGIHPEPYFVNGKAYETFSPDYDTRGILGYFSTDGEITYLEELSEYDYNSFWYGNEEVSCYSYNAEGINRKMDDHLIILYHEDGSYAIFENDILEHVTNNTNLVVEEDTIVFFGLEGEDRAQYYAVYRTDGTEILAPTLQNTSEITYRDGRFLLGTGENPVILDAAGNELFQLSELGLSHFSGFSEKLGSAEDRDGYDVYIDIDGNIAISELSVSPDVFELFS